MKRFLLSSTLNTRDIGGYEIPSGKATVYNRFLRSDVPAMVTEDDLQLMLSKEIYTIIDLRSDAEVQRKACAFKSIKSMEYYHCRIHGDGRLPETPEAVADSYLEMVDEQKTICGVMKAFSAAKGGVLYHCSAGKDRTGVVSALLLLLVGVTEADIIEDYHISWLYLENLLRQYSQANDHVNLDIITPKPEYMKKFLRLFQDKYGTVENYLVRIGLSQDEIINIKNKLIKE